MHSDCPPYDGATDLDQLGSTNGGDLSSTATIGPRDLGTSAVACFMDQRCEISGLN